MYVGKVMNVDINKGGGGDLKIGTLEGAQAG